MVKDRRKAILFILGVTVPACIIVLVVIAFVSILPHDKTRPDVAAIITALATFGLFVTTAIAAIVAFVQFKEVQRAEKIERTTDLLREWSKPRMQYLLGFIDYYATPAENIKFARRFYKLLNSHPAAAISRKNRMRRTKRRHKVEVAVHNGIQEISLMATRTWNLLDHDIIDENVLFGQLDYDILSTYVILETILNQRSDEDNYLYNEFTLLARRAQQHYRRRPYDHVVDELVAASLVDLSVGR